VETDNRNRQERTERNRTSQEVYARRKIYEAFAKFECWPLLMAPMWLDGWLRIIPLGDCSGKHDY
jgi:hypothetical protein